LKQELDNELSEALKFDPLNIAEKITGKDYQDDKYTTGLGMSFMLKNNQHKDCLLKLRDDAYFSMLFKDYAELVKDFGFSLIHEHPYKSRYDKRDEIFQVYFYEKYGIILDITSYDKRINSSTFYYNFKFKDEKYYNITSSGHCYEKDTTIWIGNHDGREALKFHIEQILQCATFIVPWVERPFLFFADSSQTKENFVSMQEPHYYENITNQVIETFPDYVKKIITP